MTKVTKEQAEIAIFQRFKIAFEKEYGIELTNVIHRDRPDFEATIPKIGNRLGLEITGVYQDEHEAKIQYWAVKEWERFNGSVDDLVRSLNDVLQKKAQKSFGYNYSGRLCLVIWLGSLVYHEKSDIDFIRNDIVIPNNTFSNIWLIVRSRDDYSPELYHLQGQELF